MSVLRRSTRDASSTLAEAFSVLRDDAAHDLAADTARVAELAERLAATLGAQATAVTAPASTASALASSLLVKVGAGLLAVGVLAVVGAEFRGATLDVSTRTQARSGPVPSSVSTKPPAPAAADVTSATAHDAGAEGGAGASAIRVRRPSKHRAAGRFDLEQEVALMERTRAAVQRDPNTALQLCREHALRHPHGVFVQEREVLAIEALLGTRRRRAAEARAATFLERFPRSPHAHRVQNLIFRSNAKTSEATDGDKTTARPQASTFGRSP